LVRGIITAVIAQPEWMEREHSVVSKGDVHSSDITLLHVGYLAEMLRIPPFDKAASKATQTFLQRFWEKSP